jgi:hypothetical protein
VFAEASGTGCSKTYGNISYNKVTLTPYITGLSLMADSDITLTSQATVGTSAAPGLIAAGDQVSLQTSSAGIWGAVVAQDECGTGAAHTGISVTDDSVQGVSLHFVANMDTPVASVIRTTLFLEL